MRIEIAPRIYAEELDRKLFMCLVRLDNGQYEILNDLYCIACFNAQSDDDAIKRFRNFIEH